MHRFKQLLTTGLMALLVLPMAVSCGQQTSEEASADEDITARVVDGKVVINDGKGNIRVIRLDRSDAEGVFVLEQEGEDSEDSDRNTFVRRGRAILIGPEGQREVVELDKLDESASMTFQFEAGGQGVFVGDGEGQWTVAPDDMILQLDRSASGFRIGVSCEEIGEGLKAQLRLPHGLLVEDVVEESPAQEADVRKFDILIEANGTSLSEINELVEAVQEAGEDESELTIRAVRNGDEVSLTVTPEKRDAGGIVVGGIVDAQDVPLQALIESGGLEVGDLDVQLNRMLPGIIQARGAQAAAEAAQGAAEKAQTALLRAEISELRAMIEQLREELRNK
ncbi:MAG: PDZ domain-containing protein [Pirellulaceae bacterium]